MIELILIILFLVGGIVYATFASHPMSFDDLFEFRFLPSRRKGHLTLEQFQAMITPRGVCLYKGMINSSWGNAPCECTGWKFKKVYYGQALCECGDFYQQHALITGQAKESGKVEMPDIESMEK